MRILIINLILHTAEKDVITRRSTNRHTMIHIMARGFMKQGHSVVLAASEEYRPTEDENAGFEVVYFPSRLTGLFKPSLLPWPKGFGKWIGEHGKEFDLVVTSEVFMLSSLVASIKLGPKVVIWQELNDYQKFMKKLPARIWYNVVARIFMRRSPVIGRSQSAKEFVSRFMPKVSEEIVDHGADEDIFYPTNERKKTFVVVSQLIPRKRIDGIIRAFAKFINKSEFSGFILDIMGDGPERQSLEALAKELGVYDKVCFHGFCYHTKWAEIARGAVAMLINTEQDLNMVTVPESIVNGTPVLMNTVPATASFVKETGVGIAIDNWNEEHLANMVRRYEEFHDACLRVRPRLTNSGCAKRIVDIATRF